MWSGSVELDGVAVSYIPLFIDPESRLSYPSECFKEMSLELDGLETVDGTCSSSSLTSDGRPTVLEQLPFLFFKITTTRTIMKMMAIEAPTATPIYRPKICLIRKIMFKMW